MKQPITRELYAYWGRLKGARLAPEHNDIDLLAIRHLLADVFTIQIDRPRRFPLKMCGTRINAYWLADQKGRSFLELWEAGDRDKVASAIAAVTEEVEPLVVGARIDASETAALDMELLLLPLRHFGKTHALMLGSLTPAQHPAWLGRRPASALNLHSMRILHASELRMPTLRHGEPPGRPNLVIHEGGKAESARL
ncbi:PAS domain-containing protein [Methylocystis sp. JAN1]|uniref:PAS domain-containing protein n=1 Tax=Methylocystis sp. JAN1 TaxID=3397211 RepID=UPI003FA23C86